MGWLEVVPLAGTWIETKILTVSPLCGESFPLRERGLKQDVPAAIPRLLPSFPLRERGLKPGHLVIDSIDSDRRSPCGNVD